MADSLLQLAFVVLHHTGIDPPHVDLLVETTPGSDLATWRLPAWPLPEDQPVEATRLRDHRRLYLTYTGPIPGGRGFVSRIDQGQCTLQVGPGSLVIQLPNARIELQRDTDERWWVRRLDAFQKPSTPVDAGDFRKTPGRAGTTLG